MKIDKKTICRWLQTNGNQIESEANKLPSRLYYLGEKMCDMREAMDISKADLELYAETKVFRAIKDLEKDGFKATQQLICAKVKKYVGYKKRKDAHIKASKDFNVIKSAYDALSAKKDALKISSYYQKEQMQSNKGKNRIDNINKLVKAKNKE